MKNMKRRLFRKIGIKEMKRRFEGNYGNFQLDLGKIEEHSREIRGHSLIFNENELIFGKHSTFR